MKKIACAALVAAAYVTMAMAHEGHHEVESPAPAPASHATAALPVLGSLVGASFLSFFNLYMH